LTVDLSFGHHLNACRRRGSAAIPLMSVLELPRDPGASADEMLASPPPAYSTMP
jgi:hypothetical protein